MKKSIIASTLVVSFLLIPSFSFALSATETCPKLTKALVLGSTDLKTKGEVTKLQNVLVKQGWLSSSNLGTKATDTTDKKGAFGIFTQSAVKSFQVSKKLAKQGAVGYGGVGPATRAALNGLCSGAGANTAGVTPQAQMRTTRMMAKIVPDNSVTNTGTVNYGTQQATGGVTATGGTISSNDAAAINAGTASLKKGTLIPAQ